MILVIHINAGEDLLRDRDREGHDPPNFFNFIYIINIFEIFKIVGNIF